MSSAEITLGAHLYLRAVEEDIPQIIEQSPEDYRGLKLAFRDMVRRLVKLDCVDKDDDGKWHINNAGLKAVSQEDAAAFLPYYQTVVMAHENVRGELIRDGMADYVKEFRELHADTIFEVEPETITRVRGDDMKAIASGALNLLQAVHDDPANAAFVSGLDKASLDTLWSVLEKSGYLMPGENPDRQAPLGDQILRGTPEEQEALYYQATHIATNLDLPDVVNQGDKPMTAAKLLKRAVDGAHVEQVEVTAGVSAGWDSDLTRPDCNSLYNVLTTGVRMIHTCQWGTQGVDTIWANTRRVDDLRIALDDYYDKGINNCLASGNFGDPKIDPTMGERLAKGIDWLNEAINTDIDAERYTGDDGGLMTQEGQTIAEDGEFGDEFANAFDDDGEVQSSAIPASADGDMASHLYGKSETRVLLPEGLIYEADQVMLEVLDNGTAEYLRQRAGRAEAEIGDVDSSKAAFGSVEDAMGHYRENFGDPRAAARASKVITFAQRANMNPERRARLRTAKIEEGRSPFKAYKPGAPDIAAKRLKRYLDDNMVLPDGKPNYPLRKFLYDANEMMVEASNRPEGEAAYEYAAKFVARDREEIEMRRQAGREKRGITRIDFPADAIGRLVSVKEASGTDPYIRLLMEPDGTAALSDPDAPKLVSRMSETPNELANSGKAPRKFGGMISVEHLKAAVQTGAEEISILVDGETPYGAIGKLEEAPARKKKKVQDIVLS